MTEASSEILIELKNYAFQYRNGKKFLFDFCLREGDRVWVRGANGSGKTTLLKISFGILERKGQARVLSEKDRFFCPSLSHFPKSFFFFELKDIRKVFEKRFGEGNGLFFSELNMKQKFVFCSDGEKKKFLLSLVPKKKLLGFDEPLGALDLNSKTKFLNWLNFNCRSWMICEHEDEIKGVQNRVFNLD